MIVLIDVMIVDYLTGVLDAYYNNQLSSKTGFKGILKKCCVLLVVTLTMIIDNYYNFNISTFLMITFVCNDLLSIAENLYNIGLDVNGVVNDVIKMIIKKFKK